MKKYLLIGSIAIVFSTGLFFGGKYLYDTWRYKQIVSDIAIQDIKTSNLKDGTYQGSFDALFVRADVSVVVKEQKITAININEHYNDRGAAAEVITDRVVASQSLKVDTISGATNSSKVLLKAVEIALEQAV